MLLGLTRADLAVLIALGSLLMALVSLSWQISAALWLDRAQIKAAISPSVLAGSGTFEQVIVVSATNEGRRPTTLTSLWLGVGQPIRWWERHILRWRRRRILAVMTYTDPMPIDPPALPCRVDVGDTVTVIYPAPAVIEKAAGAKENLIFASANATTSRDDSRPIRVSDLTETWSRRPPPKSKRSPRGRPAP